MRIGLDARWIFPEISGIGSYTRELLSQFVRLDHDHEFVLFFQNAEVMARIAEETGFAGRSNFTTQLLPYGLFSPQGQLLMPRLLRSLRLDLFHSPNYMIPLGAFPSGKAGPIKCVITLHDLIPLLFPQYAPRARKRRLFFIYRRLMREIVRRTDLIITVSEISRRDIENSLLSGLRRPPTLAVIGEGVSSRFTPGPVRANPTPGAVRRIFWVGRPDPYKNLSGLLRAFAELRKMAQFPVELRLAGAMDPRYPEAPRLAQELGVAEAVVWLGYLSDSQLLEEYRRADVFALPSFYEGFGLPVLEAMACGTPVVCSNCASLPEVVGDAALQVDPRDSSALARALMRVLSEPGLAETLIARGMERARRARWEETALRTLEAYLKLAEFEIQETR